MDRADFVVRALRGRGDVNILTGNFEKAISDFRKIRRFKNFRYMADLGISEGCEKLGKYYAALEHVKRALWYCSDKLTSIQIMNHKTFILMRLGKLGEVKLMGRTVQRLIDKSDLRKKEIYFSKAYNYYNFGIFYLQTGKFKAALDCVLKSIKIALLIKDYRRLANSYNVVSLIYKRIYKRKLSFRYLQKSLKYFVQIGDISEVAGCYNNLGNLMEDPQDAICYYKRAISIFTRIGFNMGIFEATHNIANKYLALGMCRKALSEYGTAYDLSRKMHYRLGFANSLTGMGSAFKFLGDYRSALKCLARSMAIASEIDNLEGLVENTFLVAAIKLEMNARDAYSWIRKTYRLAEKIDDLTTLVEATYEEVEYLAFKKKFTTLMKLKKKCKKLSGLESLQRENIFSKIIAIRMNGHGKKLDRSKALIRELECILKKVRDCELVYYVGLALFDYYLEKDLHKARSIYSLVKKNIDRNEFKDFYPVVLFLGAKLSYCEGRQPMNEIKRALNVARIIGKKRLVLEISRWLKSKKIEL